MPTKEMPTVILRKGYPMIEDGRGGFRHIDRGLDAELLGELQVRLPQETMDTLMAVVLDDFDEMGNVKKLPKGVEPIASTPKELLLQRIKLKNLAANGTKAMATIRALPGNWKVRKVGDGEWDFAVSRDGIKWHLFDPGPTATAKRARQRGVAGLPSAIGEDIMDMLDLTTDAIIGFASGSAFTAAAAATPTGPFGRLAAGSVAAGGATLGLETMKQMIGEIAGIEENVELSDAALLAGITTLFSFTGPFAARGLKGGAKFVGRKVLTPKMREQVKEAVLEAGAGLAGVGSGGGPRLKPERILERRIKARQGILQPIPGIDRTATVMRRLTRMASRRQIPEQALADAIEKEAGEAGLTINVAELIENRLVPLMRQVDDAGKLRVRTVEGAKAQIASAENLPSKVENLNKAIATLFEVTGENPNRASVKTVQELKQLLQRRMKDEGVIRTAPGTTQKQAERVTEFGKVVRDLQVDVRKSLESGIEPLGIMASDGSGRGYVQVMRDFQKKMEQLSRWKFWLGVDQPDPEGVKTASRFLKSLHGTGQAGFRESADALKASTGIDVIERAERAMVSELFGEQGAAKVFPRISAVGEPVGTGLGKRALTMATLGGAGTILGGPGLGLAGLAAGGTVASEAGQLAIARRGIPFVSRQAQRLGRGAVASLEATSRGDTIAVMQSIARQLMQDPERMTPEQIKKFNALPESERLKRMGGVVTQP